MAETAKSLLIGSTESYSGKSGIIMGLAAQLSQKGHSVAYSKLLGTCFDESSVAEVDQDVQCMQTSLNLKTEQVRSPLVLLTEDAIEKRLKGEDNTDYSSALSTYLQDLSGDLILMEGQSTLTEGSLFGLSMQQVAQTLETPVLLVTRYTSLQMLDSVLKAKRVLGDYLLGVVVNDVPSEGLERLKQLIIPFLENHGVTVFGILPQTELLHSISVREIARQLKAEVVCRPDRLDLMVGTLSIGAMNVNSALEYFRKGANKAVVTGGDRTDLQLAALETSTSCLILTGHMPPQSLIISRAEDLEIPILSVDYDTLKTVEIVDQTFGKIRLHEPIKVECIQDLMAKYFDVDRLLSQLSLSS
ncbi:MAG: phosphotransacetylase family protein [Microcystaceae cyanobacterium]